MLVDADELGDAWSGWGSAGDAHVLGPLDVVRRSDGHAVLLPLCTGRVVDQLGKRRAAGMMLSDGETVTVVVSLARGLTEAGSLDAQDGEWWLTDAGRPILATDAASTTIDAATRDVVTALVAATRSPATWSWLKAWPQSPRDLVRGEERAFAIAAPQPLSDAPSAGLAAGSFDALIARPLWSGGHPEGEVPPASLLERLGRHVDADAADLFSRATTSAWRTLRRPAAAPRRRVWAFAAVAVVGLVSVGLLWPAEDAPTTAQPAASASASVEGTAVAAENPPTDATPATAPVVEEPAADPPPDLASIAAELLAARSACGDDQDCLGGVVTRGATAFPSGVIDAPPAERTVTLVDDYGGVAVVRVDPVEPGGPIAQLVVIQLENGTWLLRDVYVAQQP